MKKRHFWVFSLMVFTYLAFYACNGIKSARQLFSMPTPYELYFKHLQQSQLNNTLLVSKWQQASNSALQDSLSVKLPYQEAGFFNSGQPKALAYFIHGKDGANLKVALDVVSQDTFKIFIDLYQKVENELKHLIAAEADTNVLLYPLKSDQEYVIRIQPELLAQGFYQLKINTTASLAFPVQNADHKDIGSVWGDLRDGGRRKHEGIDIFAPKGTPAIAAANGIITRVQTTRLGGKVVWLRDPKTKFNLYYAHLDSQFVTPGQRVNTGDTLGLIGNTGNARYTPPHLHFGIYRYGAKDPYPFVYQPSVVPVEYKFENEPLEQWQLTTNNVNFRQGPDLRAKILRMLPAKTPIKIVGLNKPWLKVLLPDQKVGFIHQSLVSGQIFPKKKTNKRDQMVYEWPSEFSSPVAKIPADQRYDVLAHYKDFYLTSLGWTRADLEQ